MPVEEADMESGVNVSVDCYHNQCEACDGTVNGSGTVDCEHACHEENE